MSAAKQIKRTGGPAGLSVFPRRPLPTPSRASWQEHPTWLKRDDRPLPKLKRIPHIKGQLQLFELPSAAKRSQLRYDDIPW